MLVIKPPEDPPYIRIVETHDGKYWHTSAPIEITTDLNCPECNSRLEVHVQVGVRTIGECVNCGAEFPVKISVMGVELNFDSDRLEDPHHKVVEKQGEEVKIIGD